MSDLGTFPTEPAQLTRLGEGMLPGLLGVEFTHSQAGQLPAPTTSPCPTSRARRNARPAPAAAQSAPAAAQPAQAAQAAQADQRPNRAVRIANCSGFYGDRLSALAEMVTGGPIDVVTG